MYGKLPFGESSENTTVLASVAFAESLESTPANVDSAFEPLFGSDRALIEDATSSAVGPGDMPSLSVPPGLTATSLPPALTAVSALPPLLVLVLLPVPQAAARKPTTGMDIPMTPPRRTNSRRLMWPERYSSIRWFSSSLLRE